MFSTVLKEVTGYLDRRFVLILLFPSFLFWSGLLAIFVWPMGVGSAISSWSEQPTTVQVLESVAAIAWLVFFASLLENQITWITRFYEGYWDGYLFGMGKFLRNLRKGYYQKSIANMDRQTIYYSYPPSKYSSAYLEYVMPTRLGNILRNAELYPYERYKIDAVLLWPRLLAVVPDGFSKLLEGAKSSLDLMLIVSFLSGIFAIVSGIYLLVTSGPWLLFLLCSLGGLVAARLAYLVSLSAAISYGQLIKSAFDVFKGDLLLKMGYEQPKSLLEEKKTWENLSQFVYRNFSQEPNALRYKGSTEEIEKTEQDTFSISRIQAWISYMIQKIVAWLRLK